jgi:hypothetical protein
VGFDLTTHSFRVLGGWQAETTALDHAARAGNFLLEINFDSLKKLFAQHREDYFFTFN